MEMTLSSAVASLAFVCAAAWAWKALNWVWLRPKRQERHLRQQGLSGNSYRVLHGDMKEMSAMVKQAISTPIDLSDDVCPRVLGYLMGDVISRAAFGSSFEEGIRIFQLQRQRVTLFLDVLGSSYIPGWRFLRGQTHKKIKEVNNETDDIIRGIIQKREEAMKAGGAKNDDLLGVLLESNLNEIREHKGKKEMGMSLDEVIEECKLFYLAGQETTLSFLVWSMILLAKHQDWQQRARDEVLSVFGKNKPDYEGLSQLKTVGMIMNEVLRLYPSGLELVRCVDKETKLGELSLPAGVHVSVPILVVHYDPDLWGEDAAEFKPQRFSEGVSNATTSQPAFFPFSLGPRVCIGQNFAVIESKAVLAMVLQRFFFELSPTYVHTPHMHLTLQPQHGAQIILHKI